MYKLIGKRNSIIRKDAVIPIQPLNVTMIYKECRHNHPIHPTMMMMTQSSRKRSRLECDILGRRFEHTKKTIQNYRNFLRQLPSRMKQAKQTHQH